MIEFLYDLKRLPARKTARAHSQLLQLEVEAFVDDQNQRAAMRRASGDELSRSSRQFAGLCDQEALSNIEFA